MIPGVLWVEVNTLVKLIAQDVKPKLNKRQWGTVKILIDSLLQQSRQALAQYYTQPDIEKVETLFKPVKQELDLLEDFLFVCLFE